MIVSLSTTALKLLTNKTKKNGEAGVLLLWTETVTANSWMPNMQLLWIPFLFGNVFIHFWGDWYQSCVWVQVQCYSLDVVGLVYHKDWKQVETASLASPRGRKCMYSQSIQLSAHGPHPGPGANSKWPTIHKSTTKYVNPIYSVYLSHTYAHRCDAHVLHQSSSSRRC